jgi:hypothetical protein
VADSTAVEGASAAADSTVVEALAVEVASTAGAAEVDGASLASNQGGRKSNSLLYAGCCCFGDSGPLCEARIAKQPQPSNMLPFQGSG